MSEKIINVARQAEKIISEINDWQIDASKFAVYNKQWMGAVKTEVYALKKMNKMADVVKQYNTILALLVVDGPAAFEYPTAMIELGDQLESRCFN